MNPERIIRGVAGTFVLASAILSWLHSPWWLLLTAFVGANLLQSAFTDTCPLLAVLRRLNRSKDA
ncbi:YgaP family membrane protein [Desulfocurvus sp. DL9XJH121]